MQPARNARGLATARRIEASALRLALADGLDGLTVDAVCADAGVSQRTFFHHFPTKEDALLGLDLPTLDEDRVRAYLGDPSVPLLAGMVGLVRLPQPEDETAAVARLGLLAGSPVLFRRQSERLLPLLAEVRGLVLARLRAAAPSGPEGTPVDPAGEDLLELQADVVTALGSALMQAVGIRALQAGEHPSPGAPDRMLEALRPLWDRLL